MGLKTLAVCLLFLSVQALAVVEIPLIYSLPLKKSNFSQIISADTINKSGVNSLSQVLAETSQIQLLDMYGDGSRVAVSMRGFGDNAAANSLLVLDGQPWMNPDTSGINLNSLPLATVQQIEIIPGSASVLYGDQAVGGVVKITTKAPAKGERAANLAYGSYATRKAEVLLGDKFNNNFAYRVIAANYFSHNYRAHNNNQVNSAAALLNYTTDLSQLSFSYNKYNQHLQLPCALTPEQAQENPRQATANLAYDNEDTDYFRLDVKHYFTSWLLEIDGDNRLMQGLGAYKSTPFTEARKMRVLNAKVSGVVTLRQYNFFPIIGSELLQGSYGFNDKTSRQQELANYVQLEFPLVKQVKLILGARDAAAFYKLNENGILQNPRNHAWANDVELLWEVNTNLRFFATRETSFRFPKVDEETWTVNGMPLKTQVGTTYEIGSAATVKNMDLKVSIFKLNISNEIISIPDPVSNFFTFNENLDATTRCGGNLSLLINPFANFSMLANYNLVDAKIASGVYQGNAMPFVAANSFNLAANYHFDNGIYLYLDGVYTGSRYPLNDMANRVEPFGGFTIFNFCASYKKPHYDLVLKINNLTNKLSYGYVVAGYQGNNTTLALYPSFGMNALLSLNLHM